MTLWATIASSREASSEAYSSRCLRRPCFLQTSALRQRGRPLPLRGMPAARRTARGISRSGVCGCTRATESGRPETTLQTEPNIQPFRPFQPSLKPYKSFKTVFKRLLRLSKPSSKAFKSLKTVSKPFKPTITHRQHQPEVPAQHHHHGKDTSKSTPMDRNTTVFSFTSVLSTGSLSVLIF